MTKSNILRAVWHFLSLLLVILSIVLSFTIHESLAQSTQGICDRTSQVRIAILNRIPGISNCADVTSRHLAAITGDLLLSGRGITSLTANDFAGLSSLGYLWLDNNSLSSLPSGVFEGLNSLQRLYLHNNRLSSLPSGVFLGLNPLQYLYLYNNRLSSLPNVIFSGLNSLMRLDLQGNRLSSLPSGVFEGLNSLQTLNLYGNSLSSLDADVFSGLNALQKLALDYNSSLSSLPSGVFEGLNALQRLYLQNNNLSSLPSGIFSGLNALQILELDNNSLSSLPSGIFSGLNALQVLYLQNNPGAPFHLTMELEQTRSNTFVVKVAQGAPSTITATMTITGGILSDSSKTRTVSISAGSTTSTEFTVTPNPGSESVRVALSNPRSLPSGFNGIVLEVGEILTFLPGICGRTSQVQTAILNKIADKSHCANVTDADLAAITGLLDLSARPGSGDTPAGPFADNPLTSLKAGDFADLSSLQQLHLGGNQLRNLPGGIFPDLTSLTKLYLHSNLLNSLPDDIFSSLSSLQDMSLSGNRLSSLSSGVFSGLSSLTTLYLDGNQLSSLDAGVFEGLNSLQWLDLDHNQLSSLPDGVFNGLSSSLDTLNLTNNPNTPLPLLVTLQETTQDETTPEQRTFTVEVLQAAPFHLTGSITVTDGVLSDGGNTQAVTVSAGSTTSEIITITANAGQDVSDATLSLSVDNEQIPQNVTGLTILIATSSLVYEEAESEETTRQSRARARGILEGNQAMERNARKEIRRRMNNALTNTSQTNTATFNLAGAGISPLDFLALNKTAIEQGTLSLYEVLGNSSFVVPLNGHYSFWGAGDYGQHSDNLEQMSWNGAIVHASLGFDVLVQPNVLMGVVVSWSEGEFFYTDTSGVNLIDEDYTLEMNSGYFYTDSSPLPWLRLWTIGGYGSGLVKVEGIEAGKVNSITTHTNFLTGEMGGNIRLLSFDDVFMFGGTMHVNTNAEVAFSQHHIEGRRGLIEEMTTNTQEYKVSLDGEYQMETLRPHVEVGLSEEGSGSSWEVGGGLSYVGIFVMDVKARWRGENEAGERLQLEGRLSYSTSVLSGRGVLRPYASWSLEAGEQRSYRIGSDLEYKNHTTLGLEFKRNEETSASSVEHRIMLKTNVRF